MLRCPNRADRQFHSAGAAGIVRQQSDHAVGSKYKLYMVSKRYPGGVFGNMTLSREMSRSMFQGVVVSGGGGGGGGGYVCSYCHPWGVNMVK